MRHYNREYQFQDLHEVFKQRFSKVNDTQISTQ